ncbi:hypothetical protein [Paenibacillus rhizoplanae]|uniref:hypothetical protein n=1 Tax=Paenibacillus rhizoplanae TaxID=1917181 RepID=UPI003621A3D8
MYDDNMFQRTIIHSLLYARRRKFDKIACSNNFDSECYETLANIINSIKFDDQRLERRLEQTERNMNLILDGTFKNFTNDDLESIKKINEYLQIKKEQFADFKKGRLDILSSIKEGLSSTYDTNRRLIRQLDLDDDILISRYNAYVDFQYYVENPLAKITLRVWENQLTNPNVYQRGHKFKFLVHAIRTNAENALKNAKSYPIISTSLITDEFQGTYQKSKFGFVYQPSVENVMLISNSDCYANHLPFTSSYIEAEFFSLTSTPLGPNKYFQYNDYDACKTMHIEEIEMNSIKNQKGSMEDVIESDTYNEIVLFNNADTNPIAVFLLETEKNQ